MFLKIWLPPPTITRHTPQKQPMSPRLTNESFYDGDDLDAQDTALYTRSSLSHFNQLPQNPLEDFDDVFES